MKSPLRLFVFLFLTITACYGNKPNNEPDASQLTTSIEFKICENKKLIIKLPSIIRTYVDYDYSDYNSDINAWNRYTFIYNQQDTATAQIVTLVRGKDSCNNDETKTYDHLSKLVYMYHGTPGQLKNETVDLKDTKLYIVYFNSGFLACGCYNNKSFRIELSNIKDSHLCQSIAKSIVLQNGYR